MICSWRHCAMVTISQPQPPTPTPPPSKKKNRERLKLLIIIFDHNSVELMTIYHSANLHILKT